jgi:hypothetical protein
MKKPNNNSRVVVPCRDRIRRIGSQGFGWLDARLHKQSWIELLTPETMSLYTFLCLAADTNGVSYYRHEKLATRLGLSFQSLHQNLRRLYQLDLVAYRPFQPNDSDGFHQVLELPESPPSLLEALRGPDKLM